MHNRHRYLAWPLFGALLFAAACREPAPQVMPRQISESAFHYPQDLWNAYVEGETVLAILVNAEGTVDTVWVEDSSGHEAFDSAAVLGARQLVFEPASRGGEPVPVQVILPVQFHRPRTDTTGVEPSDPEP